MKKILVATAVAAAFGVSGVQAAEDITVDVAVIGAGGAGLSAAVEAANLGAKVVVVEDLVSTGGSSLSAVEALREAGFDVMKAENMELLTVRGYTDELWRRYARGPQVFVRQATQSTVRVVRKRE